LADEILDSVYLNDDLLLLLDRHSVAETSVSSLYDNLYHSCDGPVQSAVSAEDATSDRHRTQLASGDRCDLLSSNDGSPSAVHLPSRVTACNRVQSDTERLANVASPSRQQSRLLNSFSALHSSSMSDLVSQLHIRLAPLSDLLTRHLAMLQTWLSCVSYGQLMVVLCQHIAKVNFVV